MIKKIPVAQLRVGMFVHDFNAGWMDHPFLFNKLLIKSEGDLNKVRNSRIKELFIDTERGFDVEEDVAQADAGSTPAAVEAATATAPDQSPAPAEAVAAGDKPAADAASAASDGGAPGERVAVSRPLPGYAGAASGVSLGAEMSRARAAFGEATRAVRSVMDDTRVGRQVELAPVRAVVEKITASVLRNSHAILTLRRLQQRVDDYTYNHSVGVCAMLVAFGKSLELDETMLHQLALGGLLHDVGLMKLSNELISKPGKLTDDEFKVVRSHVVMGLDIAASLPGLPRHALEVLAEHHERIDGTGYPKGLTGENISLAGRMSAIVDVYDAMTSPRAYRGPTQAADAVRRLFEGGGTLFDADLVKAFVKSVGIYPVGSLVRLESNRLAIVTALHRDNLLTPSVRVIYDAKRMYYIPPEDIDLARNAGERIAAAEDAGKWGIDVARFLI
ncbi:hypothetical protein OTERR_14210 [Oryzomicrobium terrae]|uniref:Uncharacterized protein n=1 Tax=Oryzomicrobium terrae TaxID=1735038 RepID=A0A5C1E9Q9_9RHOO|nr:HD-GYP domain-containing protein [Oryzomicrobium terrae]QEL64897.1 hypothetical protein OTERR_14210 [Oryzomicrobium terrae]